MGQILRLVVLLIGVWIVFRIVRDFLRRARDTQEPGHGSAPTKMIACAHCGTFVPHDQAIERGGKLYCSADHAKLR